MIRAIVTDIEGTTSSLSFVKEVLFPYAREHLSEFVRVHGDEPKVAALLEEVRTVAGKELEWEALIGQLCAWIDEDRKIAPLKALQGSIWEDGYRRGDFSGHVYADAVSCLRDWQARGIALYVFSSGSVHAQRLLFAHTPYGDLTPLFSGYFDITIGSKREPAAYSAITQAIGLPPREILFLSDMVEELDAARAAGMQTVWLVREGELNPAAAHAQVRNFEGIAV